MNQETNPAYQSYIVGMMSHLHGGLAYERTTVFSIEVLGAVYPKVVKRWMCYKTFGVEEPTAADQPKYWRANTLEVAKKAILWYMPNKIAAWDSINNVGNPTKSKEVNELIKYVKKKEVRRTGKASCTKRALTQHEFRLILSVFFERGNFQYRYRYCTMLK